MNQFNFKSQVCTDRFQSERLLALSLKKETADCYLFVEKEEVTIVAKPYYKIIKELDGLSFDAEIIPAWSLHRLIEMMPKCVRAHSSGDDSPRLHPYVPKFDYQGVTIENIDEILADFYQHTDLFGNLISCIEWLIEEGYFKKEERK